MPVRAAAATESKSGSPRPKDTADERPVTADTTVAAIRRVLRALEPGESSYWLTRVALLRLLGLIYCAAFAATANQIHALVGDGGLYPVELYLDRILAALKGDRAAAWMQLPTIFWFGHSDGTLAAISLIGLLLSIPLLFGYANAIQVLALWVLYMSFVHIGQLFYGYGWEIMLLEATSLAVFLCPVRSFRLLPAPGQAPPPPPSRAILWWYRWLAFRVMLGAGLIKIRGDACWRDLSCLLYHYETQPIPHALSWYLHQMPPWFHQLGVLCNHWVELIAPWFLFGPRRLRLVAGLLLVSFQLMLILSGNLSWLNWLTLAIALPCFDDRALAWLSGRQARQRAQHLVETAPAAARPRSLIIAGFSILLAWLSLNPTLNMISSRQIMNTSFDRLHLMNTYGAFGSVGKERYEIILQGTSDEEITPTTNWREYEFPGKPGDIHRRPAFIAPYHYRLDWQIWFAAMQSPESNPWLVHFIYKLLKGEDRPRAMLARDPFPEAPPRWIRAELYRYAFTRREELPGAWWSRERVGVYLPPLSSRDPALRQYIRAHGWPV